MTIVICIETEKNQVSMKIKEKDIICFYPSLNLNAITLQNIVDDANEISDDEDEDEDE